MVNSLRNLTPVFTMTSSQIELLLEFMDQAFTGPAWHGTPLQDCGQIQLVKRLTS